jgi:hypothetical protein
MHRGPMSEENETQESGYQGDGKEQVFLNAGVKPRQLAGGFDERPLDEVLERRKQKEKAGCKEDNENRSHARLDEFIRGWWILIALIHHCNKHPADFF